MSIPSLIRQVIPVDYRINQNGNYYKDSQCTGDIGGICTIPGNPNSTFDTSPASCKPGSTDSGGNGHCERTCTSGGTVYSATYINSGTCGSTSCARVYCMEPSISTCIQGFNDVNKNYMADPPAVPNPPLDYYNTCVGGQVSWFQRPWNTERISTIKDDYSNKPGMSGGICPSYCSDETLTPLNAQPMTPYAIGGQVCNFNRQKMMTAADLTSYYNTFVNPSAPNSQALNAQNNLDEMYTTWCAQQVTVDGVKDSCQTGDTKCARYFTSGNDGQQCRSHFSAVRDPMYLDTVGQNYCSRYDTAECVCLNRNKYGSTYQTLKSGNPYNDGCWYNPCNSSSNVFVTKDLFVAASNDSQCPSCYCTQSYAFFNDTSVDMDNNNNNMNCTFQNSACT